MKKIRIVLLVISLIISNVILCVFEVCAAGTLDDYAIVLDAGEAEEALFEDPPGMDKLITLDLRGMDVREALKYIAVNGGINMIVSNSVTGSVTFMLQDVKVQDVFDVLLRSNKLAYEKRGNIYTIMTEMEYQERYGRPFSDVREVMVFRLQYAIPENAFTLIDSIKSELGNVVVDQESGTMLVMDTPQKLAEIKEAIVVLEEKNNIQVFDLKYARALDVEEHLKARLDDKNVGSIQADERSNQVIVQALSERMKDIESMIASLDQKTRGVLIDAQIVRVRLDHASDVGIEWEGLQQILHRSGGVDFIGSHPYQPLDRQNISQIDDFARRYSSTTDVPAETPIFVDTAIPASGQKSSLTENIFFGKTERWEAVLNFLNTVGKSKVLANPKISVLNNQEARFHVGRREVYVTTTTTAGATTTTTSEEVNFIDVGVQLSVTPTINEDRFVTMKIRPEISSVVGVLITPSQNEIPIISTQTVESTVMVKDKSTVILGGLRRDETTKETKQPPLLAMLPFLGNLLKNKEETTSHTEVIILLTPHILDGDQLVTGDFVELGKEALK